MMSYSFCTAMIMCSSLQDGQSSLMFASQNGHIEVVRMLLSADAKLDIQDEVSTTNPSHGPMMTYALMQCCTVD